MLLNPPPRQHGQRSRLWLVTVAIVTSCSGRPDAAPAADSGAEERRAPEAAGADSLADSTRRVTLSEHAYAAAGITVEAVVRVPATAQGSGLRVPAQITFEPARVALITPRASGRIERLAAVEGDHVRAGQAVAYLSSPDFLTAQTDFVQARRRAAMLATTPDAAGAAALETAARRRLELLGAPAGLISRLEAGTEPTALLPVLSPFGGSIIRSMALAGAAVEPGAPIFQLADLAVVDAMAQVPERALAAVHQGQSATVSVPAFPEQRFPGRVTRLQSELDSTTRTVRAVIRVPNSSARLRAGMFATVELAVPASGAGRAASRDSVLAIPEGATVADGEQRYVFVEIAPRIFERRPVDVTPFAPPGGVVEPGGRLIVRSGLRAGERVVVKGAFTLESELGKATFGEQEG